MNILRSRLIGLADVDLLEIVHIHFNISTDDLQIYDYLLILCACQCISILFILFQSIRKWLILGKLKLSILRLNVYIDLRRFL